MTSSPSCFSFAVDLLTASLVQVGEIWVSSPSKARGYWDQPELSQESFHARLASSPPSSSSSYLRTGDMGFLHEHELFICGRIKDLIIVRGANHYPQDVERTAELSAPDALRPGCSAAFDTRVGEGHTDSVVYVAEVRPLSLLWPMIRVAYL